MGGIETSQCAAPTTFQFSFRIRSVETCKQGMTLNGVKQVLAYADDLDLIVDSSERLIAIIRKSY